MSIFSLMPADVVAVTLPDNDLAMKLVMAGGRLQALRTALLNASDHQKEWVVSDKLCALPDYLNWSWFPMFSGRAMSLIISLGGLADCFVRVRINNRQANDFGVYLPPNGEEIVDFARSIFGSHVPLDPPVPIGAQAIRLSEAAYNRKLPPCWFASSPNPASVVPELFVMPEMKAAWEAQGLLGAYFKAVN